MKNNSCIIPKPLLLAVILVVNCDMMKSKKQLQESETIAKQETYNIYFEIKDYEVKKIDICAQRAEYSGDTTIIYEFKANFYENDSVVATLTGDTGKIQELSGFIEVKGRVKLVSSTGDSLISNRIVWDKRLNLIYSFEESFLFKEGKTVRSHGLEANPQLTKITFKGKVYVE